MRAILKHTSLLIIIGSTAISLVSNAQSFSKPKIENIKLDDDCYKLLKFQEAKLNAAGAAKKLLAWTPLMLLAGESNAVHTAFSIYNTNWAELAQGISSVNKIALTTLATESLTHAIEHDSNPKIKEFWKAMSDFYASQASERK